MVDQPLGVTGLDSQLLEVGPSHLPAGQLPAGPHVQGGEQTLQQADSPLGKAVKKMLGEVAQVGTSPNQSRGDFQGAGGGLRKNKTLEEASWIRGAFRCWLAWLPVILATTLLSIVVYVGFSFQYSETSPLPPWVAAVCMLAVVPLTGLWIVGAIYGVFRPSRGWQDIAAGTRLIRS